MKVVRTFATSANVGPGFDTLGICFDLYNDYGFEESNQYIIEGFEEQYNNPKQNLIIQSYEKAFDLYKKEIKYIKLIQLEQNIPTSRGLGSSASCIVCGIMIANELMGNIMSKEDIFQLASSIEGHPDNVAPLIYGGFTSSYIDDKFYKVNLKINEIFKFYVCIPPFELSTSLARSVLPKQISVKDAVFNMSHAIAMIKAFEDGNMELLKTSKKDLIHEPYRYKLIKNSDIINEFALKNNAICLISGAGPTLLLVSNQKINTELINLDWKFKEVYINNEGVYIYEK